MKKKEYIAPQIEEIIIENKHLFLHTLSTEGEILDFEDEGEL